MQINFNSFKLLHNHLLSILTTNNHEDGNLGQKILQYIQMIVQSEKNKKFMEDVLDYFYEEQGISILKQVLEIQPMLSVKCLSLLFINLKNQQLISFLLCQPFLMKAIQLQQHPQQQQWAQYFISFLKSLSIRITPDQINLFYNKKFCKFPLIYESMKYYNHPDCMVRTNVMNIILGMMKMKNARVSEYFASFPFTSYLLTFCSQLAVSTTKFNTFAKGSQLQGMNQFKLKSVIKSYTIDLPDDICYLNDLHSYGSQNQNYFLNNALLAYLMVPQLNLLNQQDFYHKSALYTIYTLLKIIKDKNFAESICYILVGKNLPKKLKNRLHIDQICYPKVYTNEFKENCYYWNKFNYQITQVCQKKFKDIQHFQTDHQLKKKDYESSSQVSKQFNIQIERLSHYLGFNILNYQQFENNPPFCPKQLKIVNQDIQQNNFRKQIFKTLSSKDMQAVLAASNIIILLIKSQFISNDLLKYCGLLLPRMDTVNYLDQYNINSLLSIKKICLNFLSNLSPKQCKVATLRNILLLLQECLFKQLEKQSQKQIIINAYRSATQYFKSQIKSSNMTDIIQNYEKQYQKWINATPSIQNQLPFSIFIKQQQNISQVRSYYLIKINKRQEIIRSIQIFTLMRSFYRKYLANFQKRQLTVFSKLYNERFGKLQQAMKVGNSYQIGYRNMIQSKIIKNNQPKQRKNLSKVIIIEDNLNLIIVEPQSDKNQAKVLLNNAWKNIECSIDKQNGKKLRLHIKNSHDINNVNELYFDDEIRCAGILNLMNDLKRKRYQQQQAFILNFVKNCQVQ